MHLITANRVFDHECTLIHFQQSTIHVGLNQQTSRASQTHETCRKRKVQPNIKNKKSLNSKIRKFKLP